MSKQRTYSTSSRRTRNSVRLSIASCRFSSTGYVTATSDVRDRLRCSGRMKRRELVIEAGRSHKFNIPEEELPS